MSLLLKSSVWSTQICLKSSILHTGAKFTIADSEVSLFKWLQFKNVARLFSIYNLQESLCESFTLGDDIYISDFFKIISPNVCVCVAGGACDKEL